MKADAAFTIQSQSFEKENNAVGAILMGTIENQV